jgi:putative effector of murein hydrolase
LTERAEELGNESDAIPLSDARASSARNNSEVTFSPSPSTPSTPLPLDDLVAPRKTQDPSLIRGTGGPPETDIAVQSITRANQVLQTPLPLTRPQRWAYFINSNFDQITYLFLFLFVGIPIYYTTGYAMPVQLTFNILAYFTALSLPAPWRRFLHPVLVSAGITVLGIWILGLVKGNDLHTTLSIYRTHTTYLSLWSGSKHLPLPGAGDLLVSVLDAGIVALALPMFSYRQELKRHFFAIVIPNVTVSIGSLFVYPPLCYAIGISAKRSLAFPVRSLTLALATPAAQNLGGDANTASALAIMSGILGALIGPQILDRLKIPDGEFHISIGGFTQGFLWTLCRN